MNSISPTLGFEIQTLEYKQYKLNIWDVGGQQTIRSYWRNYFELTDGLIWVVDSADQRRLNDCKKELFDLLKQEVGYTLSERLLLMCPTETSWRFLVDLRQQTRSRRSVISGRNCSVSRTIICSIQKQTLENCRLQCYDWKWSS